jgi:DNA-binding transcriptional MerR regulator
VDSHLTAGEFQTMTGLTAKALRLYAERGIVIPAAVDPLSSYRLYAPDQLQHGTVVDLLRRARVPLTELATASDFAFDDWRESVAMNRLLEDFYLDVAEKVASFNPNQFVAHSASAPAVHWVGVVVDLGIPEDTDGKLAAFSGWATDLPAVEQALNTALAHVAIATSAASWTVVPGDALRNGKQQVLLARSVPELPGRAALEQIARQVGAATPREVAVASGTLPRRLEVTFTADSAAAMTPIDEAAAGYLHVFAFEHYVAARGVTALRRTARQVNRTGRLLGDEGAGEEGVVSVFDVEQSR